MCTINGMTFRAPLCMIFLIVHYTEQRDALIAKKNANGQNMHLSLSDKHAALER